MSAKLTPWFDGRIHKPARPGVYQQRSVYENIGYQHWNGERWSIWFPTAAEAYARRGSFVALMYQNDDWRGLTAPSKGGSA